jgi:hypothetical protein
MAKRKLGVVLALSLIVVLSVGCASSWEEEEPTLQGADSRPLTAKTAYDIAKARAQKWRASAILVDLVMVIPGSEIESGPREVFLSFRAERGLGPIRWWDLADITVDGYRGRVMVDTSFGEGSGLWTGPLDVESARWDSSDALQIAEGLGGKVYRDKHPNAHVRVLGESSIGNRVVWRLEYFSLPEVNGYELGFSIDSVTGEVLRRGPHR